MAARPKRAARAGGGGHRRSVSAENPSTYHVRFIRPDQAAELMNLFHLARTALSGKSSTNYDRMIWASEEFAKAHPGVSSTAAYKDLDGLRSNWFGRENPGGGRQRMIDLENKVRVHGGELTPGENRELRRLYGALNVGMLHRMDTGDPRDKRALAREVGRARGVNPRMGGLFVVTADEVDDFASQWPGSNLPSGHDFYFDFAGTDLVDLWAQPEGTQHTNIGPNRMDTEQWDGPALLALSRDAQTGARGEPVTGPSWMFPSAENPLRPGWKPISQQTDWDSLKRLEKQYLDLGYKTLIDPGTKVKGKVTWRLLVRGGPREVGRARGMNPGSYFKDLWEMGFNHGKVDHSEGKTPEPWYHWENYEPRVDIHAQYGEKEYLAAREAFIGGYIKGYGLTHGPLKRLERDKPNPALSAVQGLGWNPGAMSHRALTGEDPLDVAFDAGKEWGEFGAAESGVANARVRHYGFVKWFNNQAPGHLYREGPPRRRLTKSQLERAFNEGYKTGKEKAAYFRGQDDWLERTQGHRPGKSNPAASPAQYRLAQAVLSGTARETRMPASVARELVERTPAGLRSEWSRRGNPADGAAAMYATFHGAPPSETLEISEELHYHGHLAALGDLVRLKVTTPAGSKAVIDFDAGANGRDRPILSSNETGTQLYIRGGDQSIDLGALGIEGAEAERDSVVVGELDQAEYETAKQFDGHKKIVYFHRLSEESGGPLPVLVYDTMNQLLSVSGGVYKILDIGIVD